MDSGMNDGIRAGGFKAEDNGNGHTLGRVPAPSVLHPAWHSFIRFCQEVQHGEIEKLKIQDGLPVLAELTKKKVKFGS